MELWDLEAGTSVRSVRGHDEDAVTAIKVTMETSNFCAGRLSGVSHAIPGAPVVAHKSGFKLITFVLSFYLPFCVFCFSPSQKSRKIGALQC